jgi:hypothetical protein
VSSHEITVKNLIFVEEQLNRNQIIPANLNLRWRAQSFSTIGWQMPNTQQNAAAVVLELT